MTSRAKLTLVPQPVSDETQPDVDRTPPAKQNVNPKAVMGLLGIGLTIVSIVVFRRKLF